jgi:chromosomal replication initiation ATPase DnaA
MVKRTKTKDLNDRAIVLLDGIMRCAKRYGFPAIMDKLNELEVNNEETNIVFGYVLEIVQEKYDLQRKDILGTKRGIASEARKMCFVLIYSHTTLSMESIASIFDNRSKQAFFQAKKEIDNILEKPHTKYEKTFVAIHNELNAKIVDFKKTIVIESKKTNTEKT